MYKRSLLFVGLFVLLRTSVFASGFQINEHGARGMAMGGAFVGLANDPSAAYFNPAGIVQLSGTQFSAGFTYIAPMSKFTGPSPAATESELKHKFFNPASFYATHQLSDDWFVGFAFNSPFGLGTEWEDNWVGKYRTTKTEIRTFNFSPTVAYKINNQLSVAAGFTVSYSDVLIAKKLQLLVPTGIAAMPYLALPDANLELKGDNTSYGFSASMFYKATEDLSLGLSFNSQIKYKYKGTATTVRDISKDPAGVTATLNAKMPKGNISAPLTTPMSLTLGAAYNTTKDLTLTADVQYTGWSSYDKLEVTFDDMVIDTKGTKYVSSSVRDFKNNVIVRGGAEYKASDCFKIRGGAFFDQNPVKDERLDPTLPDADRIGLTAGFGYNFTNNLKVDVSYMYLKFFDRTINSSEETIPIIPVSQKLNGKYHSDTHLVGVSFSYSL